MAQKNVNRMAQIYFRDYLRRKSFISNRSPAANICVEFSETGAGKCIVAFEPICCALLRVYKGNQIESMREHEQCNILEQSCANKVCNVKLLCFATRGFEVRVNKWANRSSFLRKLIFQQLE